MLIALDADDQHGRDDREQARDHPPHPRANPPVHESFHHHLPGERAGDGAALPAGQQGDGEEDARRGRPQQRRQRVIRLLDPVLTEGDDPPAGQRHGLFAEERDRGEHHDRGVDHERDRQRQHRIDGVELNRLADRRLIRLERARLHQRRVEVQIVRHDGGADDADGDVDHSFLAEAGVQQGASHRAKVRPGLRQNEDLDEVARADRRHQNEDERFDDPHAEALKRQQQQHVQRRDDHGPEERDGREEKVDGDGAAQHFGQVARHDGDLRPDPVGPARPGGVEIARGLRQILAGDDPQTRRADLKYDGHQAGEGDDPEQAVFEACPAFQVGGPVSRVHVPDGDEQRRPGEGAVLPPEARRRRRHRDAGVHLLQRAVPGGAGGRDERQRGFLLTGHTS